MIETPDLYHLNRFLEAQQRQYEQALSEIKKGDKRSHWMWYIFPQYDGLGFSSMSRKYSIKSIAEAQAYLNHPILGQRLRECVEVLLSIKGRSAYEIFKHPDDMKLKSCATLFATVSPAGSIFEQLLNQYFQGEYDQKTLNLLNASP